MIDEQVIETATDMVDEVLSNPIAARMLAECSDDRERYELIAYYVLLRHREKTSGK